MKWLRSELSDESHFVDGVFGGWRQAVRSAPPAVANDALVAVTVSVEQPWR